SEQNVSRNLFVIQDRQVGITVFRITYIRTWQGWLYLAVVVDLYACHVVAWSMKPSLSRELALDALLMAVHGSFQARLNSNFELQIDGNFRLRMNDKLYANTQPCRCAQ